MSKTVPIYNWQVTPTGGFHFPVDHGAVLRSNTLTGLIEELSKYRANRGIDPTNAERDVHDYLCTKSPQNCKGVPQKSINEGALEPRIVKYATGLLLKQRSGQLSLVDKGEAQKRAAVCMKCPNNKAYSAGCNSCGTNVQGLLAGIRQTNQVNGAILLGGCTELGCDNKTEIWLDKGQIAAPENYVSCWKNPQKPEEKL